MKYDKIIQNSKSVYMKKTPVSQEPNYITVL